MSHDEPILDGMPEVPPAWVRPAEGVRLPAQHLDWMLLAALAHVGADVDELPVLCSVHLTVHDGLLTTASTDRYTMLRERRPVSQTCPDFAFLLRSSDASSLRTLLKALLRGIDKDEREHEPVDIALEATEEGPTLRFLGRDLDVRFTEQDSPDGYPRYDELLNRLLLALDQHGPGRFPRALNPTLLARTVPLQRAGRAMQPLSFTTPDDPDRLPAVIVRPLDPDDDVVVAIMPVRLEDGGGPS